MDDFKIQWLVLWVLGAALFVAFVLFAFPALEAV